MAGNPSSDDNPDSILIWRRTNQDAVSDKLGFCPARLNEHGAMSLNSIPSLGSHDSRDYRVRGKRTISLGKELFAQKPTARQHSYNPELLKRMIRELVDPDKIKDPLPPKSVSDVNMCKGKTSHDEPATPPGTPPDLRYSPGTRSSEGSENWGGYWWDSLAPADHTYHQHSDMDPYVLEDATNTSDQILTRIQSLPRSLRIKIGKMALGIQTGHRDNLWSKPVLKASRRVVGGQFTTQPSKANALLNIRPSIPPAMNMVHSLEDRYLGELRVMTSPDQLAEWCERVGQCPPQNHLQCIILDLLRGVENGSEVSFSENRSVERAVKRQNLQRLLSAWVVSLCRLPAWINQIMVDISRPMWLDAKEIDVYLARMWSVAKFRTDYCVWVQSLDGTH